MTLIIREASTAADVAQVRLLVRAHGDARATTPGVEYVYADADRLPGPYVGPRGGLWLAVDDNTGVGCVALRPIDADTGEVRQDERIAGNCRRRPRRVPACLWAGAVVAEARR